MENLTTTGSVLTQEKVAVKPIRRLSDWVPEGHDSQFMNDGASWTFCVPMQRDKRALVDPLKGLDQSQKEELANKLGLESSALFNIYREDNFWKKFQVKLDNRGTTLDLSEPYDFVSYRVLMCNTDLIAPAWGMRNAKQTYKYGLEREDERLKDEVTSVDNKEKAYVALHHMGASHDQMTNFMWAHYLQVKTAQRPPIDAPIDWLKKEIGKIIEHDSDLFLRILEDETYPYKVLVMKALNVGALDRIGEKYRFHGTSNVLDNLDQMVAYLQDDRNQEEFLKLKTQINIAEKTTLKSEIRNVNDDLVKEFAAPKVGTAISDDEMVLPEDIKEVREQPPVDKPEKPEELSSEDEPIT
jgi:hypothetical protein